MSLQGGGVGAYSNSQGVDFVREEVAEFIANRDGFPASAEDIFLTDGASAGVRATYTTMIDSLSGMDGMLVPIPQYPLYSALTTLHNAQLVPYYLDESAGWKLTVTELKRAITEAKAKGIRVRALVRFPSTRYSVCIPLPRPLSTRAEYSIHIASWRVSHADASPRGGVYVVGDHQPRQPDWAVPRREEHDRGGKSQPPFTARVELPF